MDLQDGVTTLGYIPGGLDCMNCSDVSVTGCGFSKLGGSGVTFNGVAQRINMAGLRVRDVSGNGIAIGASCGNDSRPFQSVDNAVTDCVVSHAGQEYTGAVGINAGYNVGLVLSHNTVTNVPYGAFSVGAGAARAGYARNNTVSYNRIARFMLKMSVQTPGMLILFGTLSSRMCRRCAAFPHAPWRCPLLDAHAHRVLIDVLAIHAVPGIYTPVSIWRLPGRTAPGFMSQGGNLARACSATTSPSKG